MGKLTRLTRCCTLRCWAVLIVLVGALLAIPSVWLWTVFVGDYFLGNPSFFRDYRIALFQREFDDYQARHPGYVKPQSFFEINASDYNFNVFQTFTNHWTVPVVIRGLFKDAPVMKWTPHTLADFFRERNRSFLVLLNNNFNQERENAWSHMDADWMPLEQMLENITNGGTNYLHNANLYFPEDLPLYRDLDLERTGFDRKTLLVQFFLGRKLPNELPRGSGSTLHCAGGPNLFLQISSAKKWTMIHPRYSRYLMPSIFNYQVGSGSAVGLIHQQKEKDRWRNFPRWEGTIFPGDAIWIPGWFWHEVVNQPSEDWSLAVATRYSTYWKLWENNWLFTWMVDLGTKDKPCPPGFRFICAALHPGFEGGSMIQSHSGISQEAVVRKLLREGKLERDVE